MIALALNAVTQSFALSASVRIRYTVASNVLLLSLAPAAIFLDIVAVRVPVSLDELC